MITGQFHHAIQIDESRCVGCIHCMRVCPTEAIRIREGKAMIIKERCIDCGQCMRACPAKAFYIRQNDLKMLQDFKYRIALFPAVMIGQFPDKITEEQIYQAMLGLGFTHLTEVEQPIKILIDLTREYLQEKMAAKPCISAFCPAVVRLIQIKYPSLVDNIIPVKAPHELAAHFILQALMNQGVKKEEIGIFYITPCAAKIAAVKSPVGDQPSLVDGVISMSDFYNKVRQAIPKEEDSDTTFQRQHLTREGILWSTSRGESSRFGNRAIAIDGIHSVVKFLDRLENDEVQGFDFLEMRACDQSCAGGILMTGNRFTTTERLEQRSNKYPSCREKELTPGLNREELTRCLLIDDIKPYNVFRLDDDISKAMEKLSKAQRIICFLPGIDCGACGAPNCQALAEDMVQGKAKMSDCVFLQQRWQNEGRIGVEKAFLNLEKKWGEGRFNADCNKRGRRNEGF
ncbi:MAG TPA: [Fe-Fe] hydrogenase large subunit C-terminal domain-containing protein [Prolixibacteraceae bacterium]|nr:[Fe-Fe] hydrogenase large subunit C-terminal domain-containing protein [Prolixibacteraceae bacterium]